MSTEQQLHPGVIALRRLVSLCQRHCGGSTVPIAEFIVSLYNAEYAKPDAYLLCRRIDAEHFEDVLTVMRWFRVAASKGDVHTYLVDGERVMLQLMKRFRLGPDELLDALDEQGNYLPDD